MNSRPPDYQSGAPARLSYGPIGIYFVSFNKVLNGDWMNEIIDVVNEKDEVVSKSDYRACHEKGFIHRTSSVFIFRDSRLKEILLIKRNQKVAEPNKFCNVGGHVQTGKDYFKTARDELQEEVLFGHKFPDGVELREVGKIFYNDMPDNNEFDMVYFVIYLGPFFPNPEETRGELEFHAIEEIKDEIKNNPNEFTVAFIKQFEKLMEYLGR